MINKNIFNKALSPFYLLDIIKIKGENYVSLYVSGIEY
jgi:hypothetical protein